MSDDLEKRVRRRTAIFTALTVAALMTACAGAQGKTVRLGSELTGSFTPVELGIGGFGFNGDIVLTPLTLVQTRLESGANVTSPVDGSVTSYRVAAANGTFAVQIVRLYPPPLPGYVGNSWGQSIASSAPTPIISTGVSPPIATHLAIKEGNSVGIRNFDGSDQLGISDQLGMSQPAINPESWSRWAAWYPPLSDGAPFQSTLLRDSPQEIGMQATVRYCKVPNLMGKSPKAARKALNAADCTVGKVKKTKKVRDKKEVLSQSVKPDTSVSDTKPIKLGLSR